MSKCYEIKNKNIESFCHCESLQFWLVISIKFGIWTMAIFYLYELKQGGGIITKCHTIYINKVYLKIKTRTIISYSKEAYPISSLWKK